MWRLRHPSLAALAAIESGDDPVLVVTPADQTVADLSAFTAAMHDAIRQAAQGAIVVLGVTPDLAPSRWKSSKCNRALIWVKMTLFDSQTTMAGLEPFQTQ